MVAQHPSPVTAGIVHVRPSDFNGGQVNFCTIYPSVLHAALLAVVGTIDKPK